MEKAGGGTLQRSAVMSNAIDVHLTDEVINAAFENTNFGRSDFCTILAETVLKRATGNYSGWKVKNKEQLMANASYFRCKF
ncbi:TPA: hypothetical protein OUD64_003841 [Enterobacter kobei]|nr:hypothetical protein [Enterobacter kobei]